MKKLVLAAMVLVGTSAFALTLKEQKELKSANDELKDPESKIVKFVKEKCGYDIPVSVDEKLATPFLSENMTISGTCDQARDSIGSMCEDETSKVLIKKSIKKIACKLGGKDKKLDISIAGGTLTVGLNTKSSNIPQQVKEYLENNLK